jgi:hypothetical protein
MQAIQSTARCHAMHEKKNMQQQHMLHHAQYVLGMEIVFVMQQLDELLLNSMDRFCVPKIQPGKRTSSKQTKSLPAMLLPCDAEMFALYRDEHDGIYVRTPCHYNMFVLQHSWINVAHVLPKDSICRAIAYRNKAGELVLGVYDLQRLLGVDQNDSNIFERQKLLYSLFAKQNPGQFIVPHWVGEEGCLVEHLKNTEFIDSLPFHVNNMLCIDNQSDFADIYKIVLRPIQITQT